MRIVSFKFWEEQARCCNCVGWVWQPAAAAQHTPTHPPSPAPCSWRGAGGGAEWGDSTHTTHYRRHSFFVFFIRLLSCICRGTWYCVHLCLLSTSLPNLLSLPTGQQMPRCSVLWRCNQIFYTNPWLIWRGDTGRVTHSTQLRCLQQQYPASLCLHCTVPPVAVWGWLKPVNDIVNAV